MFSDGKGLFGLEVAIPRLPTCKKRGHERGGNTLSSSLSRSMVEAGPSVKGTILHFGKLANELNFFSNFKRLITFSCAGELLFVLKRL